MRIELTEQQLADQQLFKEFADQEIFPYAEQFDQEERISIELIKKMADAGYLGALVPKDLGGAGYDMITFGMLNEEIGRACSSTRSLITVHSMVEYAILKWGSKHHKATWLPRLVTGEVIGAFALSEPNVGSDAKSVETTATLQGDNYILNGRKRWITYGQIADIFLVFAQYEGRVSAFLVERDRPGFTTEPMTGLLGTRASMLSELYFENCEIPKSNLIGGVGFGLSTIATSALDIGRYTVAWGSVGIAQACLNAAVAYSKQRKQFGVYLKDHQLIREMITNMITNVTAARLLCYQAGYSKDNADPKTVMETLVAKYFASRIANQAASDAVQIHGGNGCINTSPVQRYLRDAKVMEIIEGSSQIQQILIAKHVYQD